MAAGHVALLCLGIIVLTSEVVSQQRCSIPVWPPALGANPMTNSSGKVLLVAILRGYCSYCVRQAQRLEQLKNSLASQGISDIAMIIINGGELLSRRNIQNLRDASSITVLQDTNDNIMSRQVFRGNKDDFVVYDRCGQRAAYIPHPYSNLASSITRGVLRAVHAGRHNCQCSLDLASTNPHSAMYGDQPESPGYSITQNSLGLNCPQNDMMCRRYLRNYRRNRVDPMMRTRQNHISNRSRLRSLQVNGGSQQGRGHRGHGRRRHQRHLVGSHRIRNGMTA